MKKLVTSAISFFFLLTVNSQSNLGIKAGFNYSTATIIAKGVHQKVQYQVGYGAAIIFKTWFDGVLHFSPYIAYNRRGYAYVPTDGLVSKIENTVHYIDIVPALSFDFPTTSNQTFIVGFGPVVGFAITGKEKITDKNGVLTENKIVFGFGDYGRYDAGLTGNIGYRYHSYLLEISYLYSLTDLQNNDDIDSDIRNRMLSLSVGYYFK
ncbi:MAG: porin family protein [Ginsengibacter sp.]